ncbi:MAG: glycosyltransferase family 4 protein [Actinomycetota bacterium]
MDIYWYWPYLRREELGLAAGVVRPGDRLFVHATPRPDDPVVCDLPGVELLDPLPGVDEGAAERSVRWAASRAGTYVARMRARARAVRERRPDLAHVIYLNPFVDALSLRALARRVPLVATVHDVAPHERRMPVGVQRRALEREYGAAGALVVHHDWVRRRLVDEFDLDPSTIHEVPLQVIPAPLVAVDGRDGPPEVLFFGTFRRNKGLDVLLEAINRIPAGIECRFVIAGRGFADVEAAVHEAAARDPRVVAEVGYATAVRKAELYARAYVNVLPYTAFESQSGVLQDAYANGVPLIVTEVGALGETVRSEGSGWVVAPRDPDALAGAIVTAILDAPARDGFGAAMARIAEARSPARVGARLRDVYGAVLGSPQ